MYSIADPAREETDTEAILSRKPRIVETIPSEDIKEFAARESKRCLECNAICNKCVEVCPNRANIALKMEGFKNAYQILHIDAYCNECGNCGRFCPWEGDPYKDKLTIFNLCEDFLDSKNNGFLWNGSTGSLRLGDTVYSLCRREGKMTASGEIPGQYGPVLDVIDQVERDHSYLLGPVVLY